MGMDPAFKFKAVSAIIGMLAVDSVSRSKPLRITKICPVCGTEHSHRNYYCSVECCRAHKRKGSAE